MSYLSDSNVVAISAAAAQPEATVSLALVVTGQRSPVGKLHRVQPPGAWIGRAANCDIVLPDPDRFVSARHARIDYTNGLFWLSDHSTNGTFLNGETTPIGRQEPRPLRPGDRFKIGLFEVRVATDDSLTQEGILPDHMADAVSLGSGTASQAMDALNDLTQSWVPNKAPASVPLPRFDSGYESSSPDRLSALIADLTAPVSGASTYPSEPRVAEPEPPMAVPRVDPPRPLPTSIVATETTPSLPPAITPVQRVRDSLDEVAARIADEMSNLPISPSPSDNASPPAPLRSVDNATAALAAFWRGLGIVPSQIDPVELFNVMTELGLALREAAEGFGVLLRTVAPAGRAAENPLCDGHVGLRRYLQSHGDAKQPLDAAVREAFAILAEREDAYMAAVNAGVRRAVQTVSASSIEERFARSLRSSFRNGRRAELWQLLRTMEGELIDLAEMQFRKEVSNRMSGRIRKMLTYEDGGNSL